MVRLDIIAGLKNAVARGYSIEQARTSLLNAGYSIEEINEAINYVTGGVTLRDLMPKTQESTQTLKSNETPETKQTQQKDVQQLNQQSPQQMFAYQNMMNQTKKLDNLKENHIEGTNYQKALERQNRKSNFPWKVVLLILVLILLIGILVAVLLFKDNIIGFLESLLG